MKIPKVTVMDDDGCYIWTGTLTEYGRQFSTFAARECIAQFRASLAEGLTEPAFIGGGKAINHYVLLTA